MGKCSADQVRFSRARRGRGLRHPATLAIFGGHSVEEGGHHIDGEPIEEVRRAVVHLQQGSELGPQRLVIGARVDEGTAGGRRQVDRPLEQHGEPVVLFAAHDLR